MKDQRATPKFSRQEDGPHQHGLSKDAIQDAVERTEIASGSAHASSLHESDHAIASQHDSRHNVPDVDHLIRKASHSDYKQHNEP